MCHRILVVIETETNGMSSRSCWILKAMRSCVASIASAMQPCPPGVKAVSLSPHLHVSCIGRPVHVGTVLRLTQHRTFDWYTVFMGWATSSSCSDSLPAKVLLC